MAKVEAVNLACDTFEPVNGADDSLSPVIFLHGLTGYKEHWKTIPQTIADKTKRMAYAVDARNHGQSPFTEEFSFDLNVDDLFQFMDTKNIQRAVLVGHSMGGCTATRAALKKLERVESVFIEDMHLNKIHREFFMGVFQFMKMWFSSIESIPKGTSPEESVKCALDHFCSRLPKDNPFFDEERLRAADFRLKQTSDGGYDVTFNKDVICRAIENSDSLMSDPIGEYEGPAYFIYGTLSPIAVDKEKENIKKHFPNMELIKFEGATHDVHSEFPEKYLDTILERLI